MAPSEGFSQHCPAKRFHSPAHGRGPWRVSWLHPGLSPKAKPHRYMYLWRQSMPAPRNPFAWLMVACSIAGFHIFCRMTPFWKRETTHSVALLPAQFWGTSIQMGRSGKLSLHISGWPACSAVPNPGVKILHIRNLSSSMWVDAPRRKCFRINNVSFSSTMGCPCVMAGVAVAPTRMRCSQMPAGLERTGSTTKRQVPLCWKWDQLLTHFLKLWRWRMASLTLAHPAATIVLWVCYCWYLASFWPYQHVADWPYYFGRRLTSMTTSPTTTATRFLRSKREDINKWSVVWPTFRLSTNSLMSSWHEHNEVGKQWVTSSEIFWTLVQNVMTTRGHRSKSMRIMHKLEHNKTHGKFGLMTLCSTAVRGDNYHVPLGHQRYIHIGAPAIYIYIYIYICVYV